MSGSTLIVAINALLLKRTKLAGIRRPGKNATAGTPDAAAKPKPEEAPAAPANPQPDRKAAASGSPD
jgi:Cu2+-exporting ATPase